MRSREEQSILSLILAALRPGVNLWLFRKGYIMNSSDVKKNVADLLYNRHKLIAFYQTITGAGEKRDIEKLVDGVFSLLGIDPRKVSVADKKEFIAKFLTGFSPFIYFSLGEERYDQLFGRVGSTAVAAKGIIDAYADFGITGDQAENLANQFILEARSDPSLAKGFTSVELGKILRSAVKKGLIAPTTDPQVFISQARSLLAYYAAARDFFARQNKEIDIDGITEFIVKTRANYEGIPIDEAAFRFRRDLYIATISPHGLFSAGVMASGIQSPMAPETAEELDKKLRKNAIYSPAGNIAGATIRAVRVMGAGGPLALLYQQIMNGDMPRVLPAQWVQLAAASGIPPGVAIAMLRQSARNRSFLTPEVVRTLRKAQFNYDIAPYVDRIMVSYRNPELRRGALAQLAERMGYENIGMMDAGQVMAFMHSPIINSNAMSVLNYASERAKVEEEESGKIRETDPRRVTELLMNPPKNPKGGLDLGKAIPYLFGAIDTRAIKDVVDVEGARTKLMPPGPKIELDFSKKLTPDQFLYNFDVYGKIPPPAEIKGTEVLQ